MKPVGGSFRDPSGRVFVDGERVLRTIQECYRDPWEQVASSGLLESAVQQGLVIPYRECEPMAEAWKTLAVERIPFVSYPYEWCFSQLKDAALLTLDLQLMALERAMILKDASAYNVQFVGPKPLFIDLLSFEPWSSGAPWVAYRQFCRHFLAPLALCSRRGLWCGSLSRLWMDGVPLAHACRLLPWLSRLTPSLALHLYAHAAMEARHAGRTSSAGKVKRVRLTRQALSNLALSLQSAVQAQRAPKHRTQWGDYYDETNYSEEAAAEKAGFVERVAAHHPGRLAVDLGANSGRYSRVLGPHYDLVLAVDMDPLAVERNYVSLREAGPKNILPLVIDLGNPSPDLGWAGLERDSFSRRCQADSLAMLALIHHLVIVDGIPMDHVARFCASLLAPRGQLMLEFVPKEDGQVRRLLATREDIFQDYDLAGLQAAFSPLFAQQGEAQPLRGSCRTLLVFERR
jgi:hypothetical protein